MNNLKELKSKIRALVEDGDIDWTDDDYLVSKIAIVYDDAVNYLMNTCSPFITAQITVPNVSFGTTDLTSFQVAPATGAQAAGQQGAPLLGLINPLDIWYKQAYQPENNYIHCRETKDLPFITPSNYVMGQTVYWEWRAYKLFVTPLSFNADFLVKGEFKPPPLLKDTDIVQIHPSMTSALAYMTAAMIGGSRVNASYLQTWEAQASRTLDDISAQLTRKEQSTSQRVGRMGGRGGGVGRRGWC